MVSVRRPREVCIPGEGDERMRHTFTLQEYLNNSDDRLPSSFLRYMRDMVNDPAKQRAYDEQLAIADQILGDARLNDLAKTIAESEDPSLELILDRAYGVSLSKFRASQYDALVDLCQQLGVYEELNELGMFNKKMFVRPFHHFPRRIMTTLLIELVQKHVPPGRWIEDPDPE
jgi:hypothetical protein